MSFRNVVGDIFPKPRDGSLRNIPNKRTDGTREGKNRGGFVKSVNFFNCDIIAEFFMTFVSKAQKKSYDRKNYNRVKSSYVRLNEVYAFPPIRQVKSHKRRRRKTMPNHTIINILDKRD